MIVLRHSEQEVVQDPSGWERRILSPVLPGIEFEFMRTTILPGVDAGVFLPHATGSREYVAVEEGTLQLILNSIAYLFHTGDWGLLRFMNILRGYCGVCKGVFVLCPQNGEYRQ